MAEEGPGRGRDSRGWSSSTEQDEIPSPSQKHAATLPDSQQLAPTAAPREAPAGTHGSPVSTRFQEFLAEGDGIGRDRTLEPGALWILRLLRPGSAGAVRERQNPGPTPAPFPAPSPRNRQQFHDLRPPLLRSSRSPERGLTVSLPAGPFPAAHPGSRRTPAAPFLSGRQEQPRPGRTFPSPGVTLSPQPHAAPCPGHRGTNPELSRFPWCPNSIAGIGGGRRPRSL